MELYSGHINKLIEELAALPGIGSKSAQRLAFHLIGMRSEESRVGEECLLPCRSRWGPDH